MNRSISPLLGEKFRCISSECEDVCCGGWGVPIDRAAYEKLLTLPEDPLRTQILQGIELAPAGATATDGYGPEAFARIRMNAENRCPMLSTEKLCQIHAHAGPDYLPSICESYPRIERNVGGIQEMPLSLSCPEAARVILQNPIELVARQSHDVLPIWPRPIVREEGPARYFWPIRNMVLELVLNRSYPLWERLYLIGILCHQLEAIFTDNPERDVSLALDHFDEIVSPGMLRLSVEVLPLDLQSQLDAVLRLAGVMLDKSILPQRFLDCLGKFAAGIGNRPDATLEMLTACFTAAHDRYFGPFMDRHPQVMENFLINTMVRNYFPFGREALNGGRVPPMARQFAILMAQFSLMKGLLIGVSGFHGEDFAMEHVIHTVQSASKHFDHHPEFPRLAFELLAQSNLHGLHGAAILLRNQPQPSAKQMPWPLQLPAPAAKEIAA